MPRRFFPLLATLCGLVLGLPWVFAAPTPASKPSTRPASIAPSTKEELELDRKVQSLTSRAISLMEKGKLDDAKPVLLAALALDPSHTTNLYNYACLLSLKGSPDEALDYLEKAADNGWADFIHLGLDPDLKALRDLPRYKAFVARKDEFQRKAADHALASLKRQFGDGYLYDIDPERKLIYATNIDKQTLAELKSWLQKQAASQWAELFSNRPDQYVSVVVPSQADYKKIVKIENAGGLYNDDRKLLIVQQLGQTVTHEFTHALHAADRAPLGQDHPFWLAEGLASMYEAGRLDGDRLVPRDNFRLNAIQGAARVGRLLPLEKLLKMKQPEFIASPTLCYGQSSSILLFMYEQGILRKFYEAYKSGYETDPTGKKAIEATYEKPLAQFEKDWIAWMTARPKVPTDTGPNGVVIGAQLADANDGLEVKNAVIGGPASRGGIRRGDIIVAVGLNQARDQYSFFAVLMEFKPGDEVTLKVRRGEQYLELPVKLIRRSELSGKVVVPR